jgi:hypothetical protein
MVKGKRGTATKTLSALLVDCGFAAMEFEQWIICAVNRLGAIGAWTNLLLRPCRSGQSNLRHERWLFPGTMASSLYVSKAAGSSHATLWVDGTRGNLQQFEFAATRLADSCFGWQNLLFSLKGRCRQDQVSPSD